MECGPGRPRRNRLRAASVSHCLPSQTQRAIGRLGLEATRHDIGTKARSLGSMNSVVRCERHARQWAKLQEDPRTLFSCANNVSRISSTAAARRYTCLTVGAAKGPLPRNHGVGKNVASQGLPVRVNRTPSLCMPWLRFLCPPRQKPGTSSEPPSSVTKQESISTSNFVFLQPYVCSRLVLVL